MSLKINPANLFRFRNNEYYQFLMEFIAIIKGAIVSRVSTANMNDNIGSLIDILNGLMEKLDNSLMYLSKSELTTPISDADNKRDTAYRGFTLYVQAFLHSMDESKIEAARRIQVLINNYGDFRKRPYNDQTATMDNFIEDLQKLHIENIDTIGANEFYGDMKETNEVFKNLMGERHDERVAQAREEVRQLRSQIDAIYRQICGLLEVGNLLSGGESYANEINSINERIAYYNTTLAIRKGKADAKKDEEEISDEWLEVNG